MTEYAAALAEQSQMDDELQKRSEPIFFQSAEEFRSRRNYLEKIQCNGDELDHLIGKYYFAKPKWIPCGLNSCTKMHGRGYVFMRKDRKEGHCGVDCGRNHFGFSFDKVIADFRAAEKKQSELKRLRELQEDIDEVTVAAAELIKATENGVYRVSSLIKGYIENTPEVARQFAIAIKNGGKIQAADFRGKKLKNEIGLRQSKLDLVTVGYIRGYEAALQYDSIAARLKRRMTTLSRIRGLDIEALNRKERADLINDLQMVRATLQEAGVFSDNARKLTSKMGIAEIAMLSRTFPEDLGGRVRAALVKLDALAQSGLKDNN